jgi:membrane peptidoglycan carboxypeptidase
MTHDCGSLDGDFASRGVPLRKRAVWSVPIRLPRKVWIPAVVLLVAAGLLYSEGATSYFQSRYFSERAAGLTFRLVPGPSDSVCFPVFGPFDQRRGYSRIPEVLPGLVEKGYRVEAQARFSPALLDLCRKGIYAPYREKSWAGLVVLGAEEDTLYAARFPSRAYGAYDSIPDLVRRSLLFIENRDLMTGSPRKNPAVEWDRFIKAGMDQVLALFDPERSQPGASTLATQLEKFRHSRGGFTASGPDKLRQMAAASYRAYLDGPDTREARRRIVLEYMNSVPLASVPGHGEVIGIGEGLWAWFGTPLPEVTRALCGDDPADPAAMARRADAFKKVLALLIAQKRPTLFLRLDRGRLAHDTDRYLALLAREGVISARLRDAAVEAPLAWREARPVTPRPPYIDHKSANAARNRLLSLLGLDQLYALDRVDLVAQTELDGPVQRRLIHFLRRLGEPAEVEALGFRGPRLLDRGDPAKVVYSLTLYEATPQANLLRIQIDTWDQPLDVNEGTKLDLGSSAKLRTLVHYLEIVASLHAANAGAARSVLGERAAAARDPIRQWTLHRLAVAEDTTLGTTLEAALDRTYSSSPHEMFFTGGGRHRFENLSRNDDGRILTVREAFRHSVNLVFIRLMRDIVQFHIEEIPGYEPAFLQDIAHAGRQEFLARFADREGKELLARFYPRYQGKTPEENLARLAGEAGRSRKRLAALFRFVRPGADADSMARFIGRRLDTASDRDARATARLYETYAPGKLDLHDMGYSAGVHPLELWLVAYLEQHPGASWKDVVLAGAAARQDAYKWLFRTKSLDKQNQRLRIELEAQAFRSIHRAWKRLGFPFDALVPSIATAIGSSADRPASLAELVGILVNDGVRRPGRRLRALHFAPETPYETILGFRDAEGSRVLPAAVARAVRAALVDVVENGTARRCHHALSLTDGSYVTIGGKTGTGDHRYETVDRRGLVVESRVVNRAATFVFFIGDRFFGVITSYVPGPEAAAYGFTSALPVQLLARLAPELVPLLEPDTGP